MSSFLLNTRRRYNEELEALRDTAHHQLLAEKSTELDLTMLKAWRMVVHYTRWVYVNTTHCRSRFQLERWNDDGCAEFMTKVVIDHIEKMRESRGVPLVRDDTIPTPRTCLPLDLDMFGQYPAAPMKPVDTIDPFPSNYSRSPYLFSVVRVRLSLPDTGGCLSHTMTSRPSMKVQFGLALQRFYPCSEPAAYRLFDDFLHSVRQGEGATDDVAAWAASPTTTRASCAPIPLVRKFPKYLKEWNSRVTSQGARTLACGPSLLLQ